VGDIEDGLFSEEVVSASLTETEERLSVSNSPTRLSVRLFGRFGRSHSSHSLLFVFHLLHLSVYILSQHDLAVEQQQQDDDEDDDDDDRATAFPPLQVSVPGADQQQQQQRGAQGQRRSLPSMYSSDSDSQ
jgi:hypothetical protein